MKTDKDRIIDEIKDNIELNESRLNNIYSTPLTEGGMDSLMDNIDNNTFCENEIENDIDVLDILEEEDEVVKAFFGISSSITYKSDKMQYENNTRNTNR